MAPSLLPLALLALLSLVPHTQAQWGCTTAPSMPCASLINVGGPNIGGVTGITRGGLGTVVARSPVNSFIGLTPYNCCLMAAQTSPKSFFTWSVVDMESDSGNCVVFAMDTCKVSSFSTLLLSSYTGRAA